MDEILGQPAGYAWLLERHGLRVPRPRHRSYIRDDTGARKEIADGFVLDESFPAAYRPADEDFDHLVFALKYDGVDLCALSQVFRRVDRRTLAAGIEARPGSKYGRRLFFFFELLTGERLPLPDLSGAYHAALEPERYVVSAGRRVPRHRVVDNLLGVREFCPIVRRTQALEAWRARDLTARARAIASDVDAALLARAFWYLYTKETKSSFAIEREDPGTREERFAEQLARVGSVPLDSEADLVALQREIVMGPYREQHFRRAGEPEVYVGESMGLREIVHHVGARSAITPDLMRGWSGLRPATGAAAPVIEATCRSFGFVFIHPFGDGNGRIHRLLLHHTLARRGFFPDNLVVPVSAVLLRRPGEYDRILEDFSRRVMPLVRYSLDGSGELTIEEAPDDAYRYPDLTPQCEATFEWLHRALEEDLVQEIEHLRAFDEIRDRIRGIIEMPDRKERLFIRLSMDNKGRLARAKRRLFSELDDATIARLEEAIREVLERDRA